tara:strand:+ start:57 stop:545 length:489 start_codon:yes stop_codon:yes gene_type:complete
MARTSNSRGKTPFSMRSNNKTSFKMMGSSSPMKSYVDPVTSEVSDGGSSNTNSSESIYSDPNDSSINNTWINPKGVTMYRHPSGGRSSNPYDPTKTGVAHHGDSRGYYDYMGQKATSGIEEIQASQSRGRSRRAQQATKLQSQSDPSLENLSTEDFWSQYSG